jgi:cytochrome c
LNANGTTDADGDLLQYVWKVTGKNGFSKTFKTANPTITLKKAGVYTATLTVTDNKGASNTQSLELTAGNEPPVVTVDMPKGNKSFYFPNQPFAYKINVSDKEDGSLADGRINREQVAVTVDYLAEGFDKVAIAQGHRSADATAKGLKLISGNDCKSCHKAEGKSIGPAYFDIAAKYKGDKTALENLTKKVISGTSGVWGETAMAAHPQLSTEDAASMVQYILGLSETAKLNRLPIEGTYTPKLAAADKGQGVFMLRAAYADQGANGLPSCLTEQTIALRNPKIGAHDFDQFNEVQKMSFGGNQFVIPSKSGSYIGLKQIDLTSLTAVELFVSAPKPSLNAAGGDVEIRLGSPTGNLIGSLTVPITDKMNLSPPSMTLQLTPTVGVHDIYVVFKNPKAETSLMVMMGALFKN